jgi:hypothetical protein
MYEWTAYLQDEDGRRTLVGFKSEAYILAEGIEVAENMCDDGQEVVEIRRGDIAYTNPDYTQFVLDMRAEGFRVRHYNGYAGRSCPAVDVRSDMSDDDGRPTYQEVARATKVVLGADPLGKGQIVYPVR